MPRLFSVEELLTLIRGATDTENDDHVSDSFLVGHASTIYGQLHGTVVETGLRYFETKTIFTAAGGTNVLAEPADQRSWISLDYLVDGTSGGPRLPVDEIMAQERNQASPPSTSGGRARYFELVDRQYLLYPTPIAGQKYELRYIPQPQKLTDIAPGDYDTTEVDVVSEDGEGFLVHGVAVYVRVRKRQWEEANFHRQERNDARERLSEWAGQRAFHQPRRKVVSPERSYGPGPVDWWDWR